MTHIEIERLDQSGDIRTIAEEAGALDPSGTRRDLLRTAGIGAAGVGVFAGMLSPLEAFAAAASTKGKWSKKKSAANDVKIGNYALTLEYLEAAFYKQASNGGALTDPDISGFAQKLSEHEAAHVAALKKVLGSKAVKAPKVEFGNTVTDQTQFLLTAIKLEPVGTAAYQGAGPYIFSPAIVKAALSILPVEANHAAYAALLGKLKGIKTDADPAPFSFYKEAGFDGTVAQVTKTGFVTGTLQPS